MTRICALIAVLPMLVVAACGGDAPPSPEVRPVEEIVVGDIEVVSLSATSAAVQVETAIAVVCSVVFGVDQTYGQQSTDLDMGGEPHRQHRAPLTSLEPDTEYHFRLQGTGPDGTIYVSENRTFRTPPAEERNATGEVNLASAAAGARVVEVSSVFGNGATWAAENAIDGDPATAWSSAGDGDQAMIAVELASPTHVREVGIWTRTMGATAQIERFQVVTDAGEVLGPFEVPNAEGMHWFEVETRAQILRFEVVESSGGNTGAVELGVRGDPVD